MPVSCSDSEHDHGPSHRETKVHGRLLRNNKHRGWSTQRTSIGSSGIATPPPSPPISSSHQEASAGRSIAMPPRQIRLSNSEDDEHPTKRRRLTPPEISNQEGITGTPTIHADPIRSKELFRLATSDRCKGPLTRSLTNNSTIFYELGAEFATADQSRGKKCRITKRVTISIPPRPPRRSVPRPPRRARTSPGLLAASQTGRSSHFPAFFDIRPIDQWRCEFVGDDNADEDWRWATQPSVDSEDDWRWRTQSRCSSRETGVG